MRKYTRKELKNMVALGMAEDVTRANNEDYQKRRLSFSGRIFLWCLWLRWNVTQRIQNRNILCRDFQNVSNLYFWLRGENFDN